MDNTNGNPTEPQNGANSDNTNENHNVLPNRDLLFPIMSQYGAAVLESGSWSQQPFGRGHANYADLQTSNVNAYGEAQYNILNSNLNGISGVSTGNINYTNPNLNGVGQAQTADVHSRFLPNPQGAVENESMQPPPAVEKEFNSSWIADDAQFQSNFLIPQPEVPGTVISSSSGKLQMLSVRHHSAQNIVEQPHFHLENETASGMGGSAAQQFEETSSKKGESASVIIGSASNQMGEASNKSRSAIEVPVTMREGAAIADSQEGPGTSSVQQNGVNEIINTVYDPIYELLGLPVDPHLRIFLEQHRKDKNKD